MPTAAPAAKPPRPTCPALNLCLNARQRPDGTFDLEQVFTRLVVGVFPLRLQLHVHYHVLDGQGHYHMEIGAAYDEDEHAQRACPHDVELRNPHHCRDQLLRLALTLTGRGLFWVRLYANGDMIAHRGFAVAAGDAG
jgi:hypothetical protein